MYTGYVTIRHSVGGMYTVSVTDTALVECIQGLQQVDTALVE